MPYGTDFPEFLSLTGGGFEWDGEVNEDGKGDSERESERESLSRTSISGDPGRRPGDKLLIIETGYTRDRERQDTHARAAPVGV